MAFTYNLSTPLGQVRLELGDTVLDQGPRPAKANFSDAEITYFLEQEGNEVLLAVARACEVLSRQWSSAADVQVGPRRESFSQVSAGYAARASGLRAQTIQTGILVLGSAQTG